MPTLDWLNRDAAFKIANEVPYRLLETVSEHRATTTAPHVKAPSNKGSEAENAESRLDLFSALEPTSDKESIEKPMPAATVASDDNLEHAQWLSKMLPRLQLLRELLAEDGSIWVAIDDNEGHYLMVLMDEVFGRRNFVANVVW